MLFRQLQRGSNPSNRWHGHRKLLLQLRRCIAEGTSTGCLLVSQPPETGAAPVQNQSSKAPESQTSTFCTLQCENRINAKPAFNAVLPSNTSSADPATTVTRNPEGRRLPSMLLVRHRPRPHHPSGTVTLAAPAGATDSQQQLFCWSCRCARKAAGTGAAANQVVQAHCAHDHSAESGGPATPRPAHFYVVTAPTARWMRRAWRCSAKLACSSSPVPPVSAATRPAGASHWCGMQMHPHDTWHGTCLLTGSGY